MATRKDLRRVRNAFLWNIGALSIAGDIVIAISMLSYWLYTKGLFQDGILGTIYAVSPFIFAFGVVLLLHNHIPQDPRYVLVVYAAAALIFWGFTMI